jgi:hypothetical protein
MEKAPDADVVVPVRLPFIRIDTPGSGELSEASLIVPFIVCSCANATIAKKQQMLNASKRPIFLIFMLVCAPI